VGEKRIEKEARGRTKSQTSQTQDLKRFERIRGTERAAAEVGTHKESGKKKRVKRLNQTRNGRAQEVRKRKDQEKIPATARQARSGGEAGPK